MNASDCTEEYDPDGHMSDYQLSVALLLNIQDHDRGEFHWYQLFTYMFLHDTSGIIAFAMHLGGNLIFLVIIGSRVNSVIGNLATAVVYILLGVCSAAVFLIVAGPDNHGAMHGASGAILGMAGIYLVLFPVQKIICAMWIRIVPLVKSLIISKTFMRGFLLLIIYFAFDIAMNALEARLNPNGGDGVAHWAHIGGFLCGILVGLALVFSRQFKITGDLVSLIFGKLAWPLTGKPSQWATRRQTLLGSLAFSGGAAAMLGLVLLVLALYDPRTQADQFADNGSRRLTARGQRRWQYPGG